MDSSSKERFVSNIDEKYMSEKYTVDSFIGRTRLAEVNLFRSVFVKKSVHAQ